MPAHNGRFGASGGDSAADRKTDKMNIKSLI